MTKHIPFVLLIVLSVSLPAHAQLFPGILKRPRTEPTPVPELINQLEGSDQARKRSSAADDLRQYDTKQFPEAVRALIHSLENDVNPSVRAEAAQSLARMRPITQAAGQAVERASSKDPVWRVRMQAWSSLKQMQLAGYRNRGPAAVEDYIANSSPKQPAPPVQPQFQPNAPKSIFVEVPPQSTPLPSDPVPIATPVNNSLILTEPEPVQHGVPRPLPVGTPWSTAVPTPPRRISAPELIDAPSITPPPPTSSIDVP